MANEQALPFFHGALPDQDVDQLLKDEGDFLLQSRFEKGSSNTKLFLAVKSKQAIRRFEISTDAGYTLLGKNFTELKTLIENFQSSSLVVDQETIILKKPIPKGKFQLSHRDIRLLKKIGAGAYGTVYKGILIKSRIAVAVKHIDSGGKDEQGLLEMMDEARVMQLYKHVNIVKFYGFIVDRAPYLLVMEYCKEGSVEDRLRESGAMIMTAKRVDLTTQAARGLKYLHHKGCIHRDIATRNCLLAGTVLKLADFGMCRATSIYKIDLSKPQNVRWLAPEVWRTGETKFCTDIYAFGITIWEFFEYPYSSPYQAWKAIVVKRKVMAGFRMPIPEMCPDKMATLMQNCWHHDPNKRPTASELSRDLDLLNKEFNENDSKQPTLCKPPRQKTRSVISEPDSNNNNTKPKVDDEGVGKTKTAQANTPRAMSPQSHGD